MANKTVVLGGTTCIRCHKKIGKGKQAVRESHGLSHVYYHPSCYKPGYMMYHGRYVKKNSIK
jgi:hypothetical protein